MTMIKKHGTHLNNPIPDSTNRAPTREHTNSFINQTQEYPFNYKTITPRNNPLVPPPTTGMKKMIPTSSIAKILTTTIHKKNHYTNPLH